MNQEEIYIKEYLDQKKKLQNGLLAFLDNSNDSEEDYLYLLNIINEQNIQSDHEELEHFLQLILKVSNHHHRTPDFFTKIERIFQFLSDSIKQTISNYKLFKIFISNKMILLLLFKKHIITPDENIINEILTHNHEKVPKYCHFFLPEIKELINKEKLNQIENEVMDINFDNYEEKRLIGENDSYICSLIRNDSVEEFISYYNRSNFSLLSNIKPSIFETNSFLIDKTPSLIEYAAFFGSIQIFNFLKISGVKLNPSLWLYVIHSNNPTMIHILEENHVKPEDKTYKKCFEESIKCHHNDVANYIENNLLQYQNIRDFKHQKYLDEKIIPMSFKCYNYSYFPDDFESKFGFFYLCKYNYSKLVNLFLKTKEKEIKSNDEIQILNFF